MYIIRMNSAGRRRVNKPNIDKYIYLFSECSRTRTNGANVIEYSWKIDTVSINEKCTIELYQKAFLPYVATPTVATTPYIIRLINIHSPSVVHSDNGNALVNVNKGTILDMSYPFNDTKNTIKLFLEPQELSTITLSINNSINGDAGIVGTTVFVLCLKITEFEPKVITYGAGDNVNINQDGVSFS
jgi:hypothetical protein